MRLLLVLFTAAAARPRWHELSEEYTFAKYKADFGKSYAPQEDDERRVMVVVVVAAAVRREEVAAPARGNAALRERERPEHEELEAAHVYGCPGPTNGGSFATTMLP